MYGVALAAMQSTGGLLKPAIPKPAALKQVIRAIKMHALDPTLNLFGAKVSGRSGLNANREQLALHKLYRRSSIIWLVVVALLTQSTFGKGSSLSAEPAAPRTPLASPCAAFSIFVRTSFEKTYWFSCGQLAV